MPLPVPSGRHSAQLLLSQSATTSHHSFTTTRADRRRLRTQTGDRGGSQKRLGPKRLDPINSKQTMRSSSAIIIAVCGAAAAAMCDAFTPPPSYSTPKRSVNSARSQNQAGQLQQPIMLANRLQNDRDEDLLIPSLSFLNDNTSNKAKSQSSPSGIRQRLRKAGKQIWNRMDTLKAAGLYDNEEDGLIPMQSGFKMNVGLLVGAFLFKWYRARFINKVCYIFV